MEKLRLSRVTPGRCELLNFCKEAKKSGAFPVAYDPAPCR